MTNPKNPSVSSPVDASRRERLAAAGLRATPNRLAVLEVMERAPVAVSHADLEAVLPAGFDRVTLYRTLDSFVEAGLLSAVVGVDRVRRFAVLKGDPAGHHDHLHFHCDDCGRVFCLPAKPPRRPSVPEGFQVEGADLYVHGHCADCTPARQPEAQR
jgi:Fur family transcriptional regulator, ferric uptake regulator